MAIFECRLNRFYDAFCALPHAIDNDVQVAMTILVSSSIHILELKFMYISDDEEFEVEEENLIITKTEKTLIHPITGDAVPDFEGHVFPFFVPSEQFFSIKRNS